MGEKSPIVENSLKSSAIAAVRTALRPLCRLLLKHGIMHREFVELAKEIYVDVARAEYGIRGRPTNVSRVALLTGLDRKEITRLKNRGDGAEASRPERAAQQDRIARVLSGWFQDADFAGPDGKPLPLPLEGPAPSFAELVRRFGGDVPGVTILRELQRTGTVRVQDEQVHALRRNYRVDTADPASLERAGSVLGDLAETVTHNLYRETDEPSRFEARATNIALPLSQLPAYRELIASEAQAFLERVDAWLTEHEKPSDEGEPVGRVGLGVYWIQSERTADG